MYIHYDRVISDARMRASKKDLPVIKMFFLFCVPGKKK